MITLFSTVHFLNFNNHINTAFLTVVVFCLVVSCDVSPTSNETTDLPSIEFLLGDETVSEVTVPILLSDLKSHDLEIYDVEYKKNKKYKAFLFNEVLDHLYGSDYGHQNWTSISFTAIDGYNAVIDLNFFHEPDAYLVYEDLEHPEWEKIPNHGDDTVAPFYLIWTKENKIPQNGYSWPWSITDIALVNTHEAFANASPDKEAVSDGVYFGYTLYMSRCNSCHAIEGQGGLIGPDLNFPMNILEYRQEDMVRSFIKEPSKYRRGRMPDFKDLSDEELDYLIEYLHYLKDEKNRI